MYPKTPSWIQNGGSRNAFSTPFELEIRNLAFICIMTSILGKCYTILEMSCGRKISWTKCLVDEKSVGRNVLWTKNLLDEMSCGRNVNGRNVYGPNVPGLNAYSLLANWVWTSPDHREVCHFILESNYNRLIYVITQITKGNYKPVARSLIFFENKNEINEKFILETSELNWIEFMAFRHLRLRLG